jgi:hypothetical protein
VRDAYTASAYRRAGPMITLATSYACRSGNWCLDPITGETQNQVAVAHGGSDDLVTATCSSVALVNAGKCAANLGESLRRFRRQRCPAYQQRRTAHQQTWYICHYRSIRGIFLTEGFQATIRLPEVPPPSPPLTQSPAREALFHIAERLVSGVLGPFCTGSRPRGNDHFGYLGGVTFGA